jgi:hypothetical protein
MVHNLEINPHAGRHFVNGYLGMDRPLTVHGTIDFETSHSIQIDSCSIQLLGSANGVFAKDGHLNEYNNILCDLQENIEIDGSFDKGSHSIAFELSLNPLLAATLPPSYFSSLPFGKKEQLLHSKQNSYCQVQYKLHAILKHHRDNSLMRHQGTKDAQEVVHFSHLNFKSIAALQANTLKHSDYLDDFTKSHISIDSTVSHLGRKVTVDVSSIDTLVPANQIETITAEWIMFEKWHSKSAAFAFERLITLEKITPLSKFDRWAKSVTKKNHSYYGKFEFLKADSRVRFQDKTYFDIYGSCKNPTYSIDHQIRIFVKLKDRPVVKVANFTIDFMDCDSDAVEWALKRSAKDITVPSVAEFSQ